MDLEPLQRSMKRIDADEFHLRTEIGTTACAREARSAWYLGLYGYSITFSDSRYPLSNSENDTSCFVAKDTITLHLQLSNCSPLPEMHIRSDNVIRLLRLPLKSAGLPADSRGFDVKEHVARTWLLYRSLNQLDPMVCGDLQARIRVFCGIRIIHLNSFNQCWRHRITSYEPRLMTGIERC
jgi:hypothetical protein